MTPHYSRLSIALHWTMAGAIAAAWLIGEMLDSLPRGPGKATALGAHVLIGLAVLILVVPRGVAALRSPPAAAAGNTPPPSWEERLARAAHLLLYALMLLLPLTGLLAALSGRRPVPVLGLFEIQPVLAPWGLRGASKGAHEVLAKLMLGLVVLHVLATLWHALVRRDGVAARMIPPLASRGGAG